MRTSARNPFGAASYARFPEKCCLPSELATFQKGLLGMTRSYSGFEGLTVNCRNYARLVRERSRIASHVPGPNQLESKLAIIAIISVNEL